MFSLQRGAMIDAPSSVFVATSRDERQMRAACEYSDRDLRRNRSPRAMSSYACCESQACKLYMRTLVARMDYSVKFVLLNAT